MLSRYRLGWITAVPAAINKLAMSVQASSCGPCSITQVSQNEWGLRRVMRWAKVGVMEGAGGGGEVVCAACR